MYEKNMKNIKKTQYNREINSVINGVVLNNNKITSASNFNFNLICLHFPSESFFLQMLLRKQGFLLCNQRTIKF